jgi:hypothetical protein
MAVGAVVARILTQYSDKGSKAAQRDIAKLGKQFDGFAKKTTRAFGIAAAAVGAFAVKVGKDAVQAAIADQKSQALLANSLRNTVGATDAAIASVEDYISKLQVQVGVADDDLRPALSRLAAVTGDVAAAQQLLGTALNISAFAGVDLGTATSAVTRALQGNFKTLQKLVPSINATAVKSKDLAAIFAEVQKTTQGSAATRANTLEYRLAILRIRYNEILETLGYKLLPIIEKFVNSIERDILPALNKWIKANQDDLVKGLTSATKAFVEFLKLAIAFGKWITDNFDNIQKFAILLTGIWATAKVYKFVEAIGAVALAFKAMNTEALLAGAAGAAATGGGASAAAKFLAGARALGIAGAAITGITALTVALSKISPGEKARSATKSGNTKRASEKAASAGLRSKNVANKASQSAKVDPTASLAATLVKLQNDLNSAKTKELTIEQKIINAMLKKYGLSLMTSEIEAQATAGAIEANLKKQAAISGNALTSVGSRLPFNLKKAGTGDINVYVQGSVISERDLVTVVTQAQQKKMTTGAPIGSKYDNGFGGGGGFFRTQVI